jgi:riboflavin biosynthesis pyrimidine reductase
MTQLRPKRYSLENMEVKKQRPTHQSTNTTSRTVLADNPKLRVYLEGVENDIDVSGIGIL